MAENRRSDGGPPHGGDLASDLTKLDGASLILLYTDPTVTQGTRVLVFDGLDFALGNDATAGPSRLTGPVVFNHGAMAFDRTAELSLVVGGASAAGADEISISGNRTVSNCLDGGNGAAWDHDSIPVSVPAGTASTTVQAISPPGAAQPDYLNWAVGVLVIPLEGPSVPASNTCPAPQGDPVPPAGDPASPPSETVPAPAADAEAPVVSGLTVASRRPARTRVKYGLSEAAKVKFVVQRKRGGRFVRVGRPFALRAHPGANAFRLAARIRRSLLRPGRYRVVAVATDGAGNRSRPVRARFRLTR